MIQYQIVLSPQHYKLPMIHGPFIWTFSMKQVVVPFPCNTTGVDTVQVLLCGSSSGLQQVSHSEPQSHGENLRWAPRSVCGFCHNRDILEDDFTPVPLRSLLQLDHEVCL